MDITTSSFTSIRDGSSLRPFGLETDQFDYCGLLCSQSRELSDLIENLPLAGVASPFEGHEFQVKGTGFSLYISHTK
jgi:hypothetical protein